jgi:hypothetical protein
VTVYPRGMEPLACRRHPDTETYLRCSVCETPICPECWVEAAVGYHCPDCASSRGQEVADRPARGRGAASGMVRADRSSASGGASGTGMSPTLVARTVAIGISAMVLGGFLLAPVMQQGTFFLLSAGAIGWGVARATYWGANETATSLVRSLALAFAGATAVIGMLAAGGPSAETGVLFLAYPAALYGGWIAVRNR